MKNFLLTCFLALLCLVGRYLAASSRVADSPPEKSLHRSTLQPVSPHSGDAHRGGEILPDTYPRIDFGLVDQHLDPGAGEGTPSLQPAPVTVSAYKLSQINKISNQLSLELSGDETSIIGHLSTLADQTLVHRGGSEIRNPKSEIQNLTPGFSLVDDSISQGQEEGNTPAQVGEISKADSLSIGDLIPKGIEFTAILNSDSDRILLDDYRGKYVFLEFWAPTCTASIASLPVMDGLQRKYEDDIVILPITVFPEDRIAAILGNNRQLEALDLPFVVNAPLMRSYFPHSVIPHVVILNPDGEIIAITGIEDVTEKNIEQLLADGKSLFRKKSDTRITLPSEERIISEAPQVKNKNLWFQSALTGYIPEVNGSLNQNFSEMSHIRIINMPLLYHYSLAFSDSDKVDYYSFNRVDTLGFDPGELWTKKMGRDYEDWMAEGTHAFGYELIAPSYVNPYQLMREDLKRFLPHIQATVEKKLRKVYAVVQQEGKTYPPSSGGERSYKATGGVQMTNYPLQGFVYHLNAVFQRKSPDPFINLTGIDYPIDLSLNANLSDVESLRAALRENGLDLIHREEEINVLVLKKIAEPKLLTP